MQIEYHASSHGNRVTAATAKEAVRLFLATYKNRSFDVMEYRDGRFYFTLGRPNPSDCFHKSFKSRDEAKAFLTTTD